MTNAMDTFYIMLRDRLATINPFRTVTVRGVTRPGVLVEANELATTEVIADVFLLRWKAIAIDVLQPLPLATMTCEIHYATAGTALNGSMDRGRLLGAMDQELSSALRMVPHNTLKFNYTASSVGVLPTAMQTNVFWSDAVYSPAQVDAALLKRVATVEVFSYQEAGE